MRIDVEDPDTGLPAPRRTFRWAEVHGQQLGDRVAEAIPPNRGRRLGRVDIAPPERIFVPLANPFFRFFIGIGVLPSGLFTNGTLDESVGFPFPAPFDVIPQALGEDLGTEVGAFRINEASFAVLPSELDPQIGEIYRENMTGAQHTFIIGLGNDESDTNCRPRNGMTRAMPVRRSFWPEYPSSVLSSRISTATRSFRTMLGKRSIQPCPAH